MDKGSSLSPFIPAYIVLLLLFFQYIVARPYRCPTQHSGLGEYVHDTRNFVHREKFPLIIGIHEVTRGMSVKQCFTSCEINENCVMAYHSQRKNRKKCALVFINTSNIRIGCHDWTMASNPENTFGLFRCEGSRGCLAMEKMCPYCNDISLDMLILYAKCHSTQPKFLQTACDELRGVTSLTDNGVVSTSSDDNSDGFFDFSTTKTTTSTTTWRPPITTTTTTTPWWAIRTTTAADPPRPSTQFLQRWRWRTVKSTTITESPWIQKPSRTDSNGHAIFCDSWSENGQCQLNPTYMCDVCHAECGHRCPSTATATPISMSKTTTNKWSRFENLVVTEPPIFVTTRGQLPTKRTNLNNSSSNNNSKRISSPQNPIDSTIESACVDKDSNCQYWDRFCNNLKYIRNHCPATCNSCHQKNNQ